MADINPSVPQYPQTNYQAPEPQVNGQDVTEYVQQQATNPQLAQNTTMTPELIQENANEIQQAPQQAQQQTANPYMATAGQAQAQQAQQATTVDQNQQAFQAQQGTGTYQAAQGQAAQGTVDPNSLMSEQYKQLMDFEAGNIPDWAKGAVKNAQAMANARGLGASSIAAQATTAALMEAAKPIAQFDANVYREMNLANLANRQQTMLSNVAAENAARQFNAQSSAQVQQFFASLQKDIQTQNAARIDAMKQFYDAEANKLSATNAGLQTQVSEANAARKTAVEQFNSQLEAQRQQFNIQNQLVVDQSNVAWRRSINTANTAAINAANQTNVQNAFNLSQQALANIWQQWRDESSWVNQASQNYLTRATQVALVALNRQAQADFLDDQQENEFYQALGSFAANIVGSIFN